MILKASRPLEYVCFYPAEFSTVKDGDVYSFLAVDVFSGFVFMTGTERERTDATVLKHVRLLMEDKDFKKHRHKGFTLVFHKYEEIKPDILSVIAPFGGCMLMDDAAVAEVVAPVLGSIFKDYQLSSNR